MTRIGAHLVVAAALVPSACQSAPSPAREVAPEGRAAYYEMVIRRVAECFGEQGEDDLEAMVRFVVERDGTVSDLRLVEESGDAEFDAAALAAVECAERVGGFGPLPETVPGDGLPVSFSFRPKGRG